VASTDCRPELRGDPEESAQGDREETEDPALAHPEDPGEIPQVNPVENLGASPAEEEPCPPVGETSPADPCPVAAPFLAEETSPAVGPADPFLADPYRVETFPAEEAVTSPAVEEFPEEPEAPFPKGEGDSSPEDGADHPLPEEEAATSPAGVAATFPEGAAGHPLRAEEAATSPAEEAGFFPADRPSPALAEDLLPRALPGCRRSADTRVAARPSRCRSAAAHCNAGMRTERGASSESA
jgi:hypothetical protein